MRKIIIIIILLLPLFVNAQSTYYVAPDGDDEGNGTIVDPWATWGHAFNASGVVAGDTVYFRGGVYYKDHNTEPQSNFALGYGYIGYEIDNRGTSGNPIYYWAYPGEQPILDCSLDPEDDGSGTNVAVRSNVSYCHFKGLTIRKVLQAETGGMTETSAWLISGCEETIFENCVVHDIGGTGFKLWSGDFIKFINCDAYNCCDSLGDNGYQFGNDGAGFSLFDISDGDSVIVKGCRAWNCGDQGFSISNDGEEAYLLVDSCWSFRNGVMTTGSAPGLGHGFKAGWSQPDTDSTILRNSLSIYNRYSAFTTNDVGHLSGNLRVYNNLFYGSYDFNGLGYGGYGVQINNYDGDGTDRWFYNNISYDHQSVNQIYAGTYVGTNNTWQTSTGVTVTDDDFLNIDSVAIIGILLGPRNADSTLKWGDLRNYLGLASTSDLIDAGIDKGVGDDIGAFQYAAQNPAVNPTVITGQIWNTSKTGARVIGNTTDDGGGDVSQKGVCWSESENPDTGDNKTEEGAGAGSFNSVITGLTENTTYHVRAYATNEAGTAYGADQEFKTLKAGYVGNGVNILWHNGKIIYF